MPTAQWFSTFFRSALFLAGAGTAKLFIFVALTCVFAFRQASAQITAGYYPGASSTTSLRTLYNGGAMSHLTYLIYAFADVDSSGNCYLNEAPPNDYSEYNALQQQITGAQSVDGIADSSDATQLHGDFNQILKLKNLLKLQGITLKVLLSVGGSAYSGPGANNTQGTFSQAASHYTTFASSCVNTFIKGDYSSYGITAQKYPSIFDGFDID